VWVAKRPKLVATGATLDDALDQLSTVICSATGDGEAALSLWPLQPPQSWDAKYLVANGALLIGDGSVHPAGDGRELFSKGWCPSCRTPRGERTTEPITMEYAGEGDVCSLWWKHGREGLDYDPLAVSDRFLKLLTRAEQASTEWREMKMPARCRRTYFEWIPRKTVATVCVKGWKTDGNRCVVCRSLFASSSNHPRGRSSYDSITHFVARHHVDKLTPFVGVGVRRAMHPYVPIERASALIGDSASRGMRLWLLGAVPKTMVLARPRVQDYDGRNEPTLKQMIAKVFSAPMDT